MKKVILKLLIQAAVYLFKKYAKTIAVEERDSILTSAIGEIGSDEIRTLSSSTVKKQWQFLIDFATLVLWVRDNLPTYMLTGGELWRHEIMQDYYRKMGLSQATRSKHQDRLAVDINVFIDGVYRTDGGAHKEIAEKWKSLSPSNVSGTEWGWDYNHYQKS